MRQRSSISKGLTIHIDSDPLDEVKEELLAYWSARKYSQHSGSWFGLSLAPGTGKITFGVYGKSPWVHDKARDEATRGRPSMRSSKSLSKPKRKWMRRMEPLPKAATVKVGRNAARP